MRQNVSRIAADKISLDLDLGKKLRIGHPQDRPRRLAAWMGVVHYISTQNWHKEFFPTIYFNASIIVLTGKNNVWG